MESGFVSVRKSRRVLLKLVVGFSLLGCIGFALCAFQQEATNLKAKRQVLPTKIDGFYWSYTYFEDSDIFMVLLTNEKSQFKWENQNGVLYFNGKKYDNSKRQIIISRAGKCYEFPLTGKLKLAVKNKDYNTISSYIQAATKTNSL